MPIALVATSIAMFCLSVTLAWLYARSRSRCARLQAESERYAAIADLEKHASEQAAKRDAALAEVARAESALEQVNSTISQQKGAITSQESQIAAHQRDLMTLATALGEYKTLEELGRRIEKQKHLANQYNQLLGNFKTAEELKAYIQQQKSRVQELNQTIGKFESLPELDRQIAVQQAQMKTLESRIQGLHEVLAGADNAVALQSRIRAQQASLAELAAQTKQVEEALEMQEFGFYRPRYDFESSSKYQETLDRVRDQQTAMVKSDSAVRWEKMWVVEGSDVKGRKMMKEQTKLMLRAFNGECDAAVAKVKYNNAAALEARINRSYEQVNKLGKTNSAGITEPFLQLKLQELYLTHEYRVKQQQEREEQQRIREQMRDEERARREVEEAQEKAARDEEVAETALEKARRAFEAATRGQLDATEQTKAQNTALAAQVSKLENELKEAIDRKAKAIARAQLTKSGYVYILSNVGSFGQNTYKLGLTRRLDPLERVKELGDASVPFPFDVHAVVYSDNAPELECKLHQHFADRRVNLVNLRREYFQVTLEEIMAAVKLYFGEITFVKFPEAAEYRETLAKRKAEGIALPAPVYAEPSNSVGAQLVH